MMRGFGKPVRFALIGGIGFLVDAAGLFFLMKAGLDPFIARWISAPVAMMVTFVLNRCITFAAYRGRLMTALGRYLLSQYVGFGFNLAIYTSLLKFTPDPFNHPFFCIVVASGAALAINYIGSRSFVFVDRRP